MESYPRLTLSFGADLARVCNICFAMLFDDAALEATFSDFLKTAPSGAPQL